MDKVERGVEEDNDGEEGEGRGEGQEGEDGKGQRGKAEIAAVLAALQLRLERPFENSPCGGWVGRSSSALFVHTHASQRRT